MKFTVRAAYEKKTRMIASIIDAENQNPIHYKHSKN